MQILILEPPASWKSKLVSKIGLYERLGEEWQGLSMAFGLSSLEICKFMVRETGIPPYHKLYHWFIYVSFISIWKHAAVFIKQQTSLISNFAIHNKIGRLNNRSLFVVLTTHNSMVPRDKSLTNSKGQGFRRSGFHLSAIKLFTFTLD